MTRIEVTTHFLEMHECSDEPSLLPAGTAVVRDARLDTSTYRKLYRDVGALWLWYERSELSDSALSDLIHQPGVFIHLLQHEGQVAGFAEIELNESTSGPHAQILYFGLLPQFIGAGLGRRFLKWLVLNAFQQQIVRLWVHTCSLDHARALDTYEQAGFREYKRDSGWVRINQGALALQNQVHGHFPQISIPEKKPR